MLACQGFCWLRVPRLEKNVTQGNDYTNPSGHGQGDPEGLSPGLRAVFRALESGGVSPRLFEAQWPSANWPPTNHWSWF